jgi:hypothetical protein
VRFDQRIEAEMAINKLNNKVQDNMTEPLIVKFANSPTSIKSVMGLPLAPFIPISRGFYQPYRSTTNSSYRLKFFIELLSQVLFKKIKYF